MQFQRELAAYLAQFTPGPRNVYRRLIERIGPHRAVYASLNYDLLFEIAAARMQLNTIYGLEREPASVRLLKLHGSSNFWPDIPVGMLRNCSIFNSGRADVQAPIRPLDQAETLYRCRVEDSLSPAIAMYAEGKAVKVSPDYVDRQQSLWKVAVAEARRIFVVGVRVHNADVHVWGELEKAKAPVTYFGFSGDRAAFEDWRHLRGRRESYFIEADFSRSVDMIATSIGSRR